MMPPFLQDRFQQLLDHAKNPAYRLTARENIAAVKELVDTLHILGRLNSVEYRARHQQITTIKIMINTAELKRCADLMENARQYAANPEAVHAAIEMKP